MVKKILPTTIIRDNPDIEYKPFLEYLEDDDLYAQKSNNETKDFLCKNIMYNDEVIEINKRIVKLSSKPVFESKEFDFNDFDTKLFDRYNKIRSYFISLNFSYDDLYNIEPSNKKYNSFNSRIFTRTCSDFQIIPVVYNDFYSDIEKRHMLEDYSSFSVIIDYTKGIIYINDVLLNIMKLSRSKKFTVICNILVNIDKIKWGEDVYKDEIQLENGKILLEKIKNDTKEIEPFSLDFIPQHGKYTRITNPYEFVTDDEKFMITVNNIPYEIYKDFSSVMNGSLYHNDEFGYFSEDKNRTAINVLAYDIAKRGLLKPIVVNKFNGRFIIQSKTRFLIAQYLKLPEIPVVIYTAIEAKTPEIKSINVFEKSQYGKTKLSHELRKIILPEVSDCIIDEVELQ